MLESVAQLPLNLIVCAFLASAQHTPITHCLLSVRNVVPNASLLFLAMALLCLVRCSTWFTSLVSSALVLHMNGEWRDITLVPPCFLLMPSVLQQVEHHVPPSLAHAIIVECTRLLFSIILCICMNCCSAAVRGQVDGGVPG